MKIIEEYLKFNKISSISIFQKFSGNDLSLLPDK